MKNPRVDEDIPLGHAVFLIRSGGGGAEMIPDTATFQVSGQLFSAEDMDPDMIDEEMLSALDHLRFLLKSRTEERHS